MKNITISIPLPISEPYEVAVTDCQNALVATLTEQNPSVTVDASCAHTASAYAVDPPSGFVCKAMRVDGVRILRNGPFIGQTDGKKGILSTWFRLNNMADGLKGAFLQEEGNHFSWGRNLDNTVAIDIDRNDGASTRVRMSTVQTFHANSPWHHFLMWWDLPTMKHCYVDGLPNLATQVWTDHPAIDYTGQYWTIASSSGAGSSPSLNADLAEHMWFPNQCPDHSLISVEDFVAKFRTAEGRPADVGNNGELVTGIPPILYLSARNGDDVAAVLANRGTGGGLVVTHGTPLIVPGPSD
jgi:hypothetical protein